MTDTEIRHKIMFFLHEKHKNDPVTATSAKNIAEELSLSYKEVIEPAITDLAGKGFIKSVGFGKGGEWLLTPKGVEYVEAVKSGIPAFMVEPPPTREKELVQKINDLVKRRSEIGLGSTEDKLLEIKIDQLKFYLSRHDVKRADIRSKRANIRATFALILSFLSIVAAVLLGIFVNGPGK